MMLQIYHISEFFWDGATQLIITEVSKV